jgi:hypothetical protein
MYSRSKIKIEKEAFDTLVNLSLDLNWLSDETEAFGCLWDICDSTRQKNLVVDLLKRTRVLTSRDLKLICRKIADKIINDWDLKSQDTFIIAITNSNEADGAQSFISILKRAFSGIPNWKEKNFLNKIGAIQEISSNSNVILLDDFIGTGKTIQRRVKWVQDKIEEMGKFEIRLKIISIAAMKFAEPILKDLTIEYFIPILLKKGISEFYQNEELSNAILDMESLENKLASKYNKKALKVFNFGYRKSETLYALEASSVPNNVFPIFWWSKLANGKPMKTIFGRL